MFTDNRIFATALIAALIIGPTVLAEDLENRKGNIEVKAEGQWEIFEWSDDDPLRKYEIGDVIVLSGTVRRNSIVTYGHRGKISYYPVTIDKKYEGSIIKARFTVIDGGERQGIKLLEIIDSFDLNTIRSQIINDYQRLLPQIKKKTYIEESKLVLPEEPRLNSILLVSPPEGWKTFYVAIIHYDLMYASHVGFRYHKLGEGYYLNRSWANQHFKGE